MSITTLTRAAQHLFLRFKPAFWALAFTALCTQGAQAQTIGEFRSRQDGNWNNASTWEQYAGSSLGWVTQYQTGVTPVSPTVQGNNSGSQNSNVTSHTISLPSGIVAGELLLVVFSVDGNPTVNINTGVSGNNWTKLDQASNGVNVTGAIFYKVAEASNALTLTTTASERSSHRSYRISGGTVFQVFGASANGGNATTANPPSLTPALGSAPYLWIATASKDGNAQVATGAPTNFTGLLTTSVANAEGASTSTAIRSLTGTNQDPGNFTGFGSSEEWVSYTLAVYSTNPSYSSISFPQTGFPVVGGINTSSQNTATTTHDVALPSGIYPGDLLLIFWTDEDNTSSITTTGWTELYNNLVGNRRRSAYYRIATGSEEGVATFTTSATETSAHNSYRIEAGSYHGVPTAETTPATGTNASPNPPSHTPGGGSKSFLWIAASHSAGNTTGTAPTNYSNLISGYTGTVGDNHARTMTARRELAAASEDPATFALGSNRSWAANTIAIRGSGTATVLNGHTVTSTANVSVPDVVVESDGSVFANNGTSFTTPAGGTFAVNGTLQMGTNGTALMTGAGAFSLNSGGTLGITNGAGITTSGATGNVQNTGRTYNNAANYIYNGSSAQNTGNGLTQGVNIMIDNAAGVTMNNNVVATEAIFLATGTLAPNAANRIGNSTRIVFDGGGLGTNGNSDVVGTMDLTSTGTIALGGGNHSLTFANSSSEGWSGSGLTITGWTGTPGLTGTNGKVFVGPGGLTSTQRAKISFDGYSGTPVIRANGELVPPGTPAALAITAGAFDHGSSCVDVAAATIQYTITNTGGVAADVEVTSNNSEFAVSNAPVEVLGSGGTAVFNVTFTPSAIGARSATITIVWDGYVTALELPVTGTGFVVNETASIGYAGSPYCSADGTATVSLGGFGGGTYGSTAGLSINAGTGTVDLGASTPGTYTVTYTFGACLQQTNASITIDQATLWYADADEDGAGDPLGSMLACAQPAGYVSNSTDQCPDDGAKTEMGICGCGVSDVDTDGDGTVDCEDPCPLDPLKTEPGFCGCGIADADNDANGIPDCLADDVVRLHLRSSQTNTGTSAYVRDLLSPQGSPSTNVVTNNTSSTTFSERLSFTIDHGALTSSIGSGGAFLASVNVNAVSSAANLQYRFRVVRQNAAGVVQEATPYSQTWNTTGIRSIPLLMPATSWAASDRLVLSVEVRATSGSNRNITIATNNANSWLGYVPSKSVDVYRSAQSGPWSDIASWQQQYDDGRWEAATGVPASLGPVSVPGYPQVAGTATSEKTAATGTSHAVSLPSGIQTGDLLLVFWVDAGTSSTMTIPSGWTALYNFVGTANQRRVGMYRVANGSEGTTLAVTTSAAERSAHTAYRIAAGSYQGVPVAGSAVSNENTTADPPSLTSGFGNVPTLWIAAAHIYGNATSPAPANYSDLIFGYTGDVGAAHARMATSIRALQAMSENPGTIALGTSRVWGANTIAIRGGNMNVYPKSVTTVRSGHSITVSNVQVADDVVVENGGTLDLASGSLTLNGSSLVTDGTISGAAGALVLDGGPSDMAITVSGSGALNVYDLTVATFGGVTMSANTGIRGTLQLNDGVFTANGAVQLVSNAGGTGRLGPVGVTASYVGDLRVNRHIPAGATNWRMMGSPVAGQTVNNWKDDFYTAGFPGSHSPTFSNPVGSGILWPSVRWYDETNTGATVNDGLVGATNIAQSLAAGQGFAAWCGTGLTTTTAFNVAVTGNPHVANTPLTLPMTYTNTGVPDADGWNMVSNPLASPIAFDQISRGADVADYITYFNPANGNLATWDISEGLGTNGGSNVIQSSQGFWLKATGPAVNTTVTEQAKVSGNTGGFFGGSQVQTSSLVRLRIQSTINQYSDETVVVFSSGEPEVTGRDVPKFVFAHPDAPQIGTQGDAGQLIAINAFGSYTTDISIPVKVDVAVNGSYTIVASEFLNIGLSCLSLEDLATNTVTPLTDGASYTFTALSSENANGARFVLRATAPMALVVTPASCNGRDDGAASVDIGNGPADITWTNAQGDVVLEQNAVLSGMSELAALVAGRYGVRISGEGACGALNTTFVIEEPAAIEAESVTMPSTCPVSADGTIDLTVLGGQAPFTYLWSNEATTEDLEVTGGTYTVLITDANGCTFAPQAYVVGAGEGPDAGIGVESTVVMAGEEVLFTPNTLEGVTNTWDFGDGHTSSDLEALHSYQLPGTYTVTLSVDDGTCVSTASIAVQVESSTGVATRVGHGLNAWVSGDHIVVDHDFGTQHPVIIRVLSTSGQLAKEHRVSHAPARITLSSSDLASGVWLVRVSSGEHMKTFSLPILH